VLLEDHPESELLIEIMKAAVLYRELLNDFERSFMSDITTRYAKFGARLNFEEKQLAVLSQLSIKLNVKLIKL
jgi:hypothetical protein